MKVHYACLDKNIKKKDLSLASVLVRVSCVLKDCVGECVCVPFSINDMTVSSERLLGTWACVCVRMPKCASKIDREGVAYTGVRRKGTKSIIISG